jgi:RHS repeat-associated protein
MIEELGGGGNLLADYTQGAGIDEPLATTGTGGTYFYHADGLGSITSLTDSTGNVAASYVYDSFGKLTASTGSITNPFQYTAREFDSETGLYYYRARNYDPNAGRFLSEDPIRMVGGLDFYSYVKNNPVASNDPTGLIHQAWTEEPYDGRLHDDTTGLEVLCTNKNTMARDIEWLELSIMVRSAEITRLGKNAGLGHILRRDAEEKTLQRCKECRDRDKKPEHEREPTWKDVKDSVRKTVKAMADYCSKHPVVCVGIGLAPTIQPFPLPLPD